MKTGSDAEDGLALAADTRTRAKSKTAHHAVGSRHQGEPTAASSGIASATASLSPNADVRASDAITDGRTHALVLSASTPSMIGAPSRTYLPNGIRRLIGTVRQRAAATQKSSCQGVHDATVVGS